LSSAYGAGEGFPHQIINKPFIVEPNSCCSQTYLVIGPFSSKKRCENVISYMKTKFFRFHVMMKKNAQHNMKDVFSFVPIQNFDEEWTDEKLFKKYKLNEDEINFIEKNIKPID
jgi:site-specific DNA-methyltransferase (adenine-specific)